MLAIPHQESDAKPSPADSQIAPAPPRLPSPLAGHHPGHLPEPGRGADAGFIHCANPTYGLLDEYNAGHIAGNQESIL